MSYFGKKLKFLVKTTDNISMLIFNKSEIPHFKNIRKLGVQNNDQAFIKVLNKYLKQWCDGIHINGSNFKTIGNFIKEKLTVGNLNESDLFDFMWNELSYYKNHLQLIQYCKTNDIDALIKIFENPSFEIDYKFKFKRKLSHDSLLSSEGKNYSSTVLKIIFKYTNLTISHDDHICLRNAFQSESELGNISMFYNSLEDFKQGLLIAKKYKPEYYTPENIEILLRKQAISIAL